MNKQNIPKIVKVKWKDATTRQDIAMSIEDAKKEKLVEAETIGYLIHQDKEKTIISPFVFIDNENMDMFPKALHIIPTKTIKNIIEL
jgi:Holliday junction resolvase-like predicted endonuclease